MDAYVEVRLQINLASLAIRRISDEFVTGYNRGAEKWSEAV